MSKQLPPVRVLSNEKIAAFNERVRSGLEHALNFMLSTDEQNKIQISAFEPFLMPIDTYINVYKKKAILIKIFSDQDYQGELYWFFELKSAILLGSLMRMMPINSLEERLANNIFDATDQDSFGEVGNQLCGILDRAFRSLTKKNIHLKMDFNKKVYPDETIKLENFVNKEEYVVFLCSITIPKHGSQKLTLLLPRSLYEVMLNVEIELDGISPKLVIAHSWDKSKLERVQVAMNSRYTKVVPAEEPDTVLDLIGRPNVAAVGIDLKQLSSPLTHQEHIFLKRLVSNRTFVRLPYFLTWGNYTNAAYKEVSGLGLTGATEGSFELDFPRWTTAFTQDPSKSSK